MNVHDIEKAEATYSGFMTALKWAVPVIALIVLFVIMLIAG
ncbi:aa3-type cytochrome c oxidase subunit IV [Erythrobacter sanguineus]|jgi:glycerol-3-phosphate acyltransferase PlsY|uniref:Aa3 type cytochrome c oxidase subunit IV n=1 Tax=Erythrobacter sanguineus TaxID=198312 RepID=A0A1M7RPY1_9SPHN|nr:aa3-type cytochrome c oxidase subunit IV [Erythrobacter sanguineus]MCR9180327.1 aa3-type cytochrome c oxidase subunit IV [Erythrobacteraceae bacterium]SHN48383.1 aa3 type cytochrome c oxidase subunit IV [Erythrobacter sanguineus]